MNYYYAHKGDTHGPISLADLKEICQRGLIPDSTQVCKEGTDEWQPLSSLGIVFAAPTLPPVLSNEYSVVPFVAVIGHGRGSEAAAAQLQELIQAYARNGWEYVRLESVETYIEGQKGCFGFDNTPPRATVYSMAVFKR